MNSEHHHHDPDQQDDLLDRVHRLESLVVAVRAVVNNGQPNYKRRCDNAADALIRLLSLPSDRPLSWERQHVEALDDELQHVLSVLEGAGDDSGTAGRGDVDPEASSDHDHGLRPHVEDGGDR